jgi:LysM repeat protein
MKNDFIARLMSVVLMAAAFVLGGLLLPRFTATQLPATTAIVQVAPTVSPTFPPTTLLPTITSLPTITLRPPPTFAPPTALLQPTNSPLPTVTATVNAIVAIPSIQGLETPTPTSTEGCEPRGDWGLIYEVQANDALATIAQRYDTWIDELVTGNCLIDPDLIVIGQQLRVPGEVHPTPLLYNCAWELLTPLDYAFNIDGQGMLTFSWIGPRSPRNLIRVYRRNDLSVIIWEETIDLRQNHTIDLSQTIPTDGEFMWYVYPLDLNFQQIDCIEGGPWHFQKT